MVIRRLGFLPLHPKAQPVHIKSTGIRVSLELPETPRRRVKDAVGEWHDWEELSHITSKVLDHDRDCKLMQKLKEIRQNKYGDAISVVDKMRKQLKTSKKQSPGSIVLAPVA